MSKELEALEKIKDYSYIDDWDILHLLKKEHKEELGTIEKALKALEIIKEKQVDIHWLNGCKALEEYNDCVNPWEKELTQEEFDLLKEVFDE